MSEAQRSSPRNCASLLSVSDVSDWNGRDWAVVQGSPCGIGCGRLVRSGGWVGGGGSDTLLDPRVYPYESVVHLIVGSHVPVDMTFLAVCLFTRP